MQISPVYDGAPVLAFEGLGSMAAPVARQRLRLLELLQSLSPEQWDAPSRCDKWSVKDVVTHLVTVDRFWDISFAAGVRGEPTRFLTTFDPVSSPEQLVDGMRALSSDDVLAQFETNVRALLATLDTVTDWSAPAESPAGHVGMNAVALHALWDAWIHERDIALPLGLPVVEDAEEIDLVLRYAAALSPMFSVASGQGRRGSLAVHAQDPDVVFTVEVGDTVVVRDGGSDGPRLEGKAPDLIESFSHRGPLPSLAPQDRWLLAGLSEAFDL